MKLKENKNLWLVLSGVAIGFLVSYILKPKTIDLTKYIDEIERLENKVKAQENVLNILREKNETFTHEIDSINGVYTELLSQRINNKATDSLQREEIRKGSARYIKPAVVQTVPALASSYGNMALDEVDVLTKKIGTQTKIVFGYKGIVETKDSVIATQLKLRKNILKQESKNNLKTLFAGTFFGFLLAILLI